MSLQVLVLCTGFMKQYESTRRAFVTTGLSDVYNGTLWVTVDQSLFLSDYILNID